jgi:hypothetical protein
MVNNGSSGFFSFSSRHILLADSSASGSPGAAVVLSSVNDSRIIGNGLHDNDEGLIVTAGRPRPVGGVQPRTFRSGGIASPQGEAASVAHNSVTSRDRGRSALP